MNNDREMLTSHICQIKLVALHFLLCGHEQVIANKCRDAERTQRECEKLELSEDPFVIVVKKEGCGYLLGRPEYYKGGEYCLSLVPEHERISGSRNPKKARREQEREERRVQESKGPLTEQERQSFRDAVEEVSYYLEGRLYQERR
ncbi:hypothetical protein LTR10_009252 [Elasticomyces elasticus]|nr:hypothetical protein LTR10_009252 [Elasticomyces elasticus]KAK4971648.1 hypothetical protein LTR42_007376 [Elasticomyces elasticus]